MKIAANSTSKNSIDQASVAGKATANPLQPKSVSEGEPLQMAVDEELLQKQHNPLQLRSASDNPLNLVTNTGNPLQLIAADQPTNPFQFITELAVQKKENKTGLPDNLKLGIENLSGYSVDDVKVHYNSDKPSQLQAHAYAQGTDIHVAPGQEKHLPHEAWHVVQQKQGRVKPTLQMKGDVGVNDDRGLENEADRMGAQVTQLKPADWNSAAMNIIVGLQPGFFSTWKKIVAGINQYKALPRTSVVARKALLDQFITLIQEWKINPKHKPDSTEQRVLDIRAQLPTLEDYVREEYAELDAEAKEVAEGGHSIARHGPELTDQELDRRLHTGIAPDNVLSPAPGASSRFSSYELQLQTRQAAATSLRRAIAAAQASVLDWKQQALDLNAHGRIPLADEATTKTTARTATDATALASQGALDAYSAANNAPIAAALAQKNLRESRLAELDEERTTLEYERDGGMDIMTGDAIPPADAARAAAIAGELAVIAAAHVQAQQALVAATGVYDGLNNPKSALRATNLTNQGLVAPAQAAEALANNERDHPGENLKRYLHTNATIPLTVNTDAIAGSFVNTITLNPQYSVVEDHGQDIGSGRTGAGEVSLTAVYAAVSHNDAPLAKPAVLLALTGLGLVTDQGALADFIVTGPAPYANLQRLKAKGTGGGKAYTGAVAAAGLQKTFTMFGCGTVTLFGAADAPVPVNTAGWRAIQHFPAKADAPVGVQEKA